MTRPNSSASRQPAGSFLVHESNVRSLDEARESHRASSLSVQLGERFRAARLACGLSQAKAAKAYGCDVRTVRSWEYGAGEMPARALAWIEGLAVQRSAA